MPLDPLAADVVRVALALRPDGRVALAGGAAMLAHDFVDRPTVDVDLFTPDATDITSLIEQLLPALNERGYRVVVVRSEPTLAHLDVSGSEGQQIAVELAQDARMRPSVQLAVGAVLHPEELAADKILALFGRAAARDLVDVDALLRRYSHEDLLQFAAEKDPACDVAVFRDALSAAAARPDASFAELRVTPERAAYIRKQALEWRDTLLGEEHP